MIIKTIIIGIIAIAAVVLLGAAILPATTTVSRSMIISAEPAIVYTMVADFHSWNSWSHWAKADPSQKVTISGPDQKIGSEMSWVGKKTGTGTMTITGLEEGKLLSIQMLTLEPMKGSSMNTMTFTPVGAGTQFTWSFTAENKYPLGRWMGLMMKAMLGKAFENSQTNIKALLEAKK
jgi:hypothetical protein